jgi:glycosyltransferase involved in cell wall biosynthesis
MSEKMRVHRKETKKKKILFIVSNLKVGGGAEKSVTLLVKGLKKYYDVELLTYYDFKEEYPCEVKRHTLGYEYSNNLIKKMHRLLYLFPRITARFLKKQKYDVVISNAEDANLVCLIAKKYFHNYKLWTVIRSNIFDKKNPYYKFRKMHKYADLNIALNKGLEQEIPYKTTVISNALDLDEIRKLKDKKIPEQEKKLFNKKTIMMVGRLVEVKNHTWFFEIFKKIKNTNLIIIGSGPLEQKLKEKTKNNKNIYFLGVKKNVYAYLNKTDVFILTSHYEGMPRVLMEALAIGCVSVANDCKYGPRELLNVPMKKEVITYEKTKYGYLVPFNNKKEFKKAIISALNDKKIEPDKRFHLDKITNKWREEIDKSQARNTKK